MVLKEMETMGFEDEINPHVFILGTELCVSHSMNICTNVINAAALFVY